MSNITQIKHGERAPSNGDLERFQLGYCTNEGTLYIGNFVENELKSIPIRIKMENIDGILPIIKGGTGKTKWELNKLLYGIKTGDNIELGQLNFPEALTEDEVEAGKKYVLMLAYEDEKFIPKWVILGSEHIYDLQDTIKNSQ